MKKFFTILLLVLASLNMMAARRLAFTATFTADNGQSASFSFTQDPQRDWGDFDEQESMPCIVDTGICLYTYDYSGQTYNVVCGTHPFEYTLELIMHISPSAGLNYTLTFTNVEGSLQYMGDSARWYPITKGMVVPVTFISGEEDRSISISEMQVADDGDLVVRQTAEGIEILNNPYTDNIRLNRANGEEYMYFERENTPQVIDFNDYGTELYVWDFGGDHLYFYGQYESKDTVEMCVMETSWKLLFGDQVYTTPGTYYRTSLYNYVWNISGMDTGNGQNPGTLSYDTLTILPGNCVFYLTDDYRPRDNYHYLLENVTDDHVTMVNPNEDPEAWDVNMGTDIRVPSWILHKPAAGNGYDAFWVTTLGATLLQSQQYVNTIDLPYTIDSIGDDAFKVSGLNKIVCRATTPPAVTLNAFNRQKPDTLYVPYGSINNYLAHYAWSTLNIRDTIFLGSMRSHPVMISDDESWAFFDMDDMPECWYAIVLNDMSYSHGKQALNVYFGNEGFLPGGVDMEVYYNHSNTLREFIHNPGDTQLVYTLNYEEVLKYKIDTIFIHLSGVPMGSLTAAVEDVPCEIFYDEIKAVNLNAQNPVYIWHNQQLTQSGIYWDSIMSERDCDTIYRLELTVTQNPVIYTVDVLSDHGYVRGTGTYAAGSQIVLTVIPDTTYEFSMWSDGDTLNPRTVVVTQDTVWRALYNKVTDIQQDIEIEVQTHDTVVTDTTSCTAVIEWDKVKDAVFYDLTIYHYGEIVAQFRVDSNNTVIDSENYGPRRIVARRREGSTETIQIDIEGLQPGETYTYSLEASVQQINGRTEVVSSQSGKFNTPDPTNPVHPTSLDAVTGDMEDDNYYNLLGQRVDPKTYRGVMIHRGVKVVNL